MADWCPFAIRDPGPAHKQGGGLQNPSPPGSAKVGGIYHSMVGSWRTARAELMNRANEKSWQFSILKDGRIFQAYPVTAICWHAGNRSANIAHVGIEHEGGPLSNTREPLTEKQVDADVRLTLWLKDRFGWPGLRRSRELREHNEFRATACPSGRIPWAEIIRRAEEEDDTMATAFKVFGQGNTVWLYNGTALHKYTSGVDLARDKRLGLVPAGPVPTKSAADVKAMRRKLGID